MVEATWPPPLNLGPGVSLQWARVSPYRAVLYQVCADNPFNRKVAAVEYNHEERTFLAVTYDERSASLTDVELGITSMVEAMEHAIALLVTQRFDQQLTH